MERTAELREIIVTMAAEAAERDRAYAELARAKDEAERASRAKSRFLASASHDLRQPLHAMRLFTSLLAEKKRAKDDRRLLHNITASLESLDRLLGAVLDATRLETGLVTPAIADVPVGDVLERLGTEFAPQARDKMLELRTVSCGAVVRSDRALLERILRNLLSNAIRYTASGRILIGCRRRSSVVRIEVWDTGSGIPDDQIENAFREFERLPGAGHDDEALGLGLAIVERTARLLDHRLEVVSTPGKGSMFAIEAPAVTADARDGCRV